MKVAVLADTHTRGRSRRLPPGAWPYLATADHILHAGDACDPALLTELASLAPLDVVMGNCDGHDVRAWGARDDLEVTLGGVRIAMTHESGARSGRRARLRRTYPKARVVVFAHSHLPMNEDEGGLLLFNPGSPTWPRLAPWPSMGILWVDEGQVEGEVFPV